MKVRGLRLACAYGLRYTGTSLVATALIFSMLGASVADQSPPASFGDLTHLEYTATSNLHAAFVAPQSGDASPIAAAEVVVSTIKGAGVELSANGTAIPLTQLGKRTVNVKTGETQYFFYGVPLQPGPNTLSAAALGAHGMRSAPVSEIVYGPGTPASIQADFAANLVADGKTVVPMRVWIRDQYGHAAMPGSKLEIAILRGDARISDPVAVRPEPSASPGTQPDNGDTPAGQSAEEPIAPGGYVQIGILPGTQSGPLDVQIAAGDVRLRKTFYIAPYLRAPLVNGLITVGAGAVAGQVDGDGIGDGGGARRGRVALYASGKVGKKSLLTLAYESQNRLSPVSSYGPFVQDPNERPYQTYGDASQLADPLHSEDHLYARFENGRSSVTWGQFNAQVGTNGAGAYHQLLSGAHLELHDPADRLSVDGFTARNDMAFVSQVLPVLGLSSLLSQLRPNIVVGSDYLQLVALDRRTGAIVSEVPLSRNVDYTIDYATGVLRFVNVPLPYDENFNPQVIQLQYQYQGPGVVSRTSGGSVELGLGGGRATKLRLGYVNDATGTQNFSVASQEIARQWEGGGFALSHATSYGFMPNPGDPFPAARGGDALSFELNQQTPRDAVNLSFQNTSAGFSNPFGGLSMPGLLAYRAAFTHVVPRRVAITLSADGQSNHGVGAPDAETNESAIAHWFLTPSFTLLGGMIRHEQHSGAPQAAFANQTQTQAQVGAEYKAGKRVGITVQQFQTLSGSDAGSTQPSQTLAQINYDLQGRGRLYLRELWTAVPTTTFANAASGITFGTGATHSMQLGIERALSPATTVSSDYVVSGTGSARNVYSALGVDEKLKLSKFVSGDLLAQSANAIGPGAQGFALFGGTLAYANANTLRATIAYQTRTGFSGGSTLSSGVAGHLSPNLAVLATLQRAYSSNAKSIDDKATIAYRPSGEDTLVSLFSYQRSNGGFWNGGAASVLALDEIFRPMPGLELAAHAAYKIDGDAYYRAHTSVFGLRARQQIGTRFDVGAETRLMQLPGISGARSTDVALESGYSLVQTRLALGYNFSASADPALTGAPQRRGFYVTVTTLIDRIFGWGKDAKP